MRRVNSFCLGPSEMKEMFFSRDLQIFDREGANVGFPRWPGALHRALEPGRGGVGRVAVKEVDCPEGSGGCGRALCPSGREEAAFQEWRW